MGYFKVFWPTLAKLVYILSWSSTIITVQYTKFTKYQYFKCFNFPELAARHESGFAK